MDWAEQRSQPLLKAFGVSEESSTKVDFFIDASLGSKRYCLPKSKYYPFLYTWSPSGFQGLG